MRKLLIVSSLSLLLIGCNSDNDDAVKPEPSITLDQASTIQLTVDSVDQDTLAISFSLADDQGLPITDAGTSYEVFYLGFPGEYDSSFAVPWHQAKQVSCSADSEACDGEMVEVSQGVYLFTPSSLPEFIESMETLKYAITIHGALASNTTEIHTLP
ncbi:hypothetical protein SAMN04488540_106183 [Ferrimonas sediminum]|uniref:Uncharacterized protein n=2 Tax=Ferrimonas sediminum TaxID=718193 RepID=A0A1G8SH23_9GAMM|nr:hypothetical protein SAMN04488540_106183 [Ferrimonas sediminum]